MMYMNFLFSVFEPFFSQEPIPDLHQCIWPKAPSGEHAHRKALLTSALLLRADCANHRATAP